MPVQRNKREEIESSLIGLRLKYLLEFYKVQLALVSGTVIIVLGYYANIDNPSHLGLLQGALLFSGLSIVLQMLIYLGIYVELRTVWYKWDSKEGTRMSKTMFAFFVINLLGSIIGLLLSYLFLILNVR
jgi:hypothetical protein